jgi:hypothetical protein
MKMLDPGSVVRESEFAQAQDTAGLLSKLAASAGRVKSGQVLVPAQREEFTRLADKYMTAAGVHEKKVRDSLGFIVKNYGLNEENVFGTMAGNETQSPSTDSPLRAYIKSKWPGEVKEIDALDDTALMSRYKKTTEAYQKGAQPAARVEVDY